MCVLAMAWRASAHWPLVVIANRDELHARASAPLVRWDEPAGLIAGRDLVSGGTWLGVRDGRFAAVTNKRSIEPARDDAPSRGLLVRDVLAGRPVDEVAAYNPFNLVAVTDGEAMFTTNHPAPLTTTLVGGIYGLSNDGLDEPWPKTVAAKARLAAWLAEDGAGGADRLLAALGPDAAPPDSFGGAEASPIFIRDERYGTRCSTILTVDADGRGRLVERRFDAAAAPAGETRLDFAWLPGPA